MDTTKNREVFFASFLCVFFAFSHFAFGVTINSIRQAAQELPKPSKIHVVAIEQAIDNRINEEDNNAVHPGIKEANRYMVSEVNIFMDINSEQIKEIKTDLRDVNSLIAQHKIPDKKLNRLNLSQTKTILFKGSNSMIFNPDIPDLTLWSSSGPPKYLFGIATYGIIPEKILNSKGDVNVTECQVNGNQAVKIGIVFKTGLSIIVECDPSIGYRYRSIKWLFNGQTTSEMLASDYKEVDGVYFPFLFTQRSYSEDGNIEKEYVFSVEELDFGVKLTADDFKIFAPPGTQIADSLISETTSKIGTGRFLGIDDVIAIGRNRLQRQ